MSNAELRERVETSLREAFPTGGLQVREPDEGARDGAVVQVDFPSDSPQVTWYMSQELANRVGQGANEARDNHLDENSR